MKRKASKHPTMQLPLWRSRLFLGLFGVGFLILLARSLYLQTWNHDFLQEKGSSRFEREIEIPAHRGKIVDRNNEPLAVSTPVRSVWAVPTQVEASAAQLNKLAQYLELDKADLQKKLEGSDEFVYLRRQLAPDSAEKVAALKLSGVHTLREYRRYYPNGEVMSHILGFTNVDDQGQEGIELAQQNWLAGKAGSRRVIINRRGEIVEDLAPAQAPQEGRDLMLSIDSKLQHLAYRELKAAIERHQAKAGGAVILDVKTGELLALVNWPSYNPNNRAKFARDKARNRALTDIFEPGSTLKPFTAAIAMEAGKVKPDTIVSTAPGSYTIGSATIHDAHPHGDLTVAEIIQKSSNIGAAKMALSLPAETIWRSYSQVGFGSLPQTGFPGEVAGKLRPYRNWRPIEQATMAYGHGIAVNLVQLARAYLVFASDGEIKPVSLFKSKAQVTGQPVFTAETALTIRGMLEKAVSPQGTAPKAQVRGYRVAGKTGTAHKIEGNGYAANKYVSSFVGFAPASNPRLIVAVMIDEPSAGQYYGGLVAAPVFSSIMGEALQILHIPHDAPANNLILPAADAVTIKEEV